MAKIITSCIRGTVSLLKTVLALFLVIIGLVCLLSLSFSGRLSTQREESRTTVSSSEITRLNETIDTLKQELEQARKGHEIRLRSELSFLNGLITMDFESEPICISAAAFETMTPGHLLVDERVEGPLGKLGLVEFRLVII